MNQNQIDHEPASFGAALREAADSFAVPQADRLHERAVRRGRQIKRRRAMGTSLSAAVVVAAIGGLTAALLGLGAPTRSPTAPATGTHTVTAPTRSALARYMVENFKPLLPKGSRLISGTELTGDGYAVTGTNGVWTTSASARASYAGQNYGFLLQVTRQWVNPACGSGLFTEQCTSKPLGRGTLVSSANLTGPLATMWNYSWNLAGGVSVELQVYLSGPADVSSPHAHSPYTEQQIEAVLTSSAWTSVLNGLPLLLHCDDLQSREKPGTVPGWYCPSTGKTYPAPSIAYATGD